MKISKKILCIIAIMIVIMILLGNTCYADTLSLKSTSTMQEMSQQITMKLRDCGYTHKDYDFKGETRYEHTEIWTYNKLEYTAHIILKYYNGKYSGTIDLRSKTASGQDNPTNKPTTSSTIHDPIDDPGAWAPAADKEGNKQFADMGNTVITIFRILGTVIAVIAIMVIGLRYMFGSLEARANFKETMVPYLVGAVMVFAIPNILGVIYDLVKAINFD